MAYVVLPVNSCPTLLMLNLSLKIRNVVVTVKSVVFTTFDPVDKITIAQGMTLADECCHKL